MKKLIFFIYIMFFFVESQAQNSVYVFNNESIKYWYYRDRLKYFVYPGTEEGNSVIMTKRNDWGQESGDPQWDWVDQYNGVAWGQTHKINGYYIGMLATEYKLLKNNGQLTDAAQTLNELNLALDALIRMDKCEDTEPWNTYEAFDGFFVREDVPPVLSDDMAAGLNEGLVPGTFSEYENQFLQKPGLPFAINKNYVQCIRKFEDPQNYYCSHHETNFNSVEYNNHGDQYWDYWKNEKFTSNDEIVGTLMGLALVAHCVDDYNVKSKAQSISMQMLIFAHGNIVQFQMMFPDFSPITMDYGGNSTGVFYGMDKAVTKIMSNNDAGSIFNDLGKTDYYSALIYNLTNWTSSFNRGMYIKLTSIGGTNPLGWSVFSTIKNLGKDEKWQTFYHLLWAEIFDKNLHDFEYNFEYLVSDLLSAPCGGPYNYNGSTLSPYCSVGWGGQYKYDNDLNSQLNGTDHKGIFPGVDYMLLYNLACLAFPGGFDYEGQHYAFPYYVNQNNRKLQDEYAPLYLPGGTPSPEIASVSRPGEVRAITSITTNMVVGNQAKVINQVGQPDEQYIAGINGDITLTAGESIMLTDGFRVDAGAHFLAKIESYSCNGMPYKNANAPAWDEHYKISFYDTLASMPLEKRETVHYTGETSNITGEDFFGDESWYASDSSASPGFPVSVSLSPNPCNTFSTLTINPGQKLFLRIALLDVHGQTKTMLFEGHCEPPVRQIGFDMSTYPNGIYFIRVASDGSSSTFKLVKE